MRTSGDSNINNVYKQKWEKLCNYQVITKFQSLTGSAKHHTLCLFGVRSGKLLDEPWTESEDNELS